MEEIIAIFDNYVIYKYTNELVGGYYLCKPIGNALEYNIFLGFPDKELREMSNDEIIDDIKKVADAVVSLDGNGIYLLPMIPYSDLVDASLENDIKTDKYGNEDYSKGKFANIYYDMVAPILNDVHYNRLHEMVNMTIRMLKRDDNSTKFIHWLDMKNNKEHGEEAAKNYIKEINYHDLINGYRTKNTVIQPVGEISPTSTDTSDGGIAPVNHEFDNVNTMNNSYKKTLKPKNASFGFSNINFIFITLILSLVVGISVGYLLMK